MRKQLIKIMAVATLALGSLSGVQAGDANQKNIRTLIKSYEQALNASDVAGVLKLYKRDGVFMAPHHPSAVGIGAIKAAYTGVFKAIDLNVAFDIREIEMLADNWAFVRTNSTGTIRMNATGTKSSDGHQELFVLQKADAGKWKIARYSFSTTSPRK